MDPLFEYALYGDRYLTRNGRKALFLNKWGSPTTKAVLHVEGLGLESFSPEGQRFEHRESPFDITTPCKPGSWTPVPSHLEHLNIQLTETKKLLEKYPQNEEPIPRRGLETRINSLQEQIEQEKQKKR